MLKLRLVEARSLLGVLQFVGHGKAGQHTRRLSTSLIDKYRREAERLVQVIRNLDVQRLRLDQEQTRITALRAEASKRLRLLRNYLDEAER